jgi:hypothetical protein
MRMVVLASYLVFGAASKDAEKIAVTVSSAGRLLGGIDRVRRSRPERLSAEPAAFNTLHT